MRVLLVVSVFIGVSSNNMFMIWLCLEINFLTFFFRLACDKYTQSGSLINFFLIQRFSRAIIIFCFLIPSYLGHNFQLVVRTLLIIKIGLIPFHIWYIKLVKTLRWKLIWFLSLWQKVIPLFIIQLNFRTFLNQTVALLNSIFCVVYIYKQNNVKLIMVFSSLFLIGWIIFSMSLAQDVWIYVLTLYGITFYLLVKLIENSDISTKAKFTLIDKSRGWVFIITIVSIRGLPPFTIFFAKIYILTFIVKIRLALSFIMLICRVLLVFNYTMLIYHLLILAKKSKTLITKKSVTTITALLVVNITPYLTYLH